jgi:hypothetical protein
MYAGSGGASRSGDETTLKASAVPTHSLTVERGRRCTQARARGAHSLRASSPCSTCASTRCRAAAHAQRQRTAHGYRLSERHRAAVARECESGRYGAMAGWAGLRLRNYANGQSLQRMIRPPIALDDLSQLWQECHLAHLRFPPVWQPGHSRKQKPALCPSSGIGRSSRLASKGARQHTLGVR